jgi:hypothetical protein
VANGASSQPLGAEKTTRWCGRRAHTSSWTFTKRVFPFFFHRVSLDDRNRAELQHTFTSAAAAPSDVAYVFPLPPDASVYAFRALIDEQVVEGVVMEKAEARATFESAVAMNQKAALLQQENVEIFRLMLGNVAPGQTVLVS